MIHPRCNICCIEALVIFFLQAICTITGGVRQELRSPCINRSDISQGTFLSHRLFAPKWHLEWRYLHHFWSPSCQHLGPTGNRIFFNKKLYYVWKIIHKTWNTKKKAHFFRTGDIFVIPPFQPVFLEKTCKCSLSWFIRDAYTWDQQVMCHILGHTRFLRSYSLIFKQIWKNSNFFTIRDTFFEALNLYFCKLVSL